MKQTKMDRVGESYEGTYGTSASQERTKKRVDWICAHAAGEHILDVGCSQGIVALLLARAGKNVLAIDIDPESVFYAQQRSFSEPLSVQQRVHYVCADFLEQDLEDMSFDCILVTELLEHLEDPDACLKKISGLLRPDGQVLVMVPFGINPHPDHKRTYYYLDLLHSVERYFHPTAVKFLDGWVAVSAGPLQDGQRNDLIYDESFLADMEESIAFVDSSKQRKFDILKKHTDKEIETLTNQREKLQRQYEAEQQKYAATQQKLAEANCKQEELRQSLLTAADEHRAAIQALEAKLEATREDAREAARRTQEETQQKLEQLRQEIENQRRQHGKWKSKYLTLSQSKLGRVQNWWWKSRNERRRKKGVRSERRRTFIRNMIFQSAALTKLYYKLRPDSIPQVAGSPQKTANLPVQATVPKAISKDQYYSGRTDTAYFERIAPLLAGIADSNGSRFYEKSTLKVGCVADEFQYNTYHDVAEFIYLKPDDYQREIDVLMIVSPWRGIDMAWKGIGNPKNRDLRERLFALIRYYQERGVKTVFYSKEDPGNYQVFVEIAKECDYIFTSEQDSIADYVRDTGNNAVFYLPFGINPLYHNPIGLHKHTLPEVIFSGTWWGYKYEERIQDQTIMMDGVLRAGKELRLIDRNYSNGDMRTAFPEKYLPAVSPSIGHKDLQKVHKLYTWSINLNSAKYSSTMFASRVVELQALGCNIISNYSRGMLACFPDIPYAKSEEEVAEILRSSTEEALYEARIAGIRRAMSQETVYHRFDYILNSIGMEAPDRSRRVLVLAGDPQDSRIREMFERQSYPDKTLASLAQAGEIELQKYDCYAFFHPDYDYGPYYLEDMINAFKFTDSDFVTRDAFYRSGVLQAGAEHDYTDVFHDRFKTVFWNSIPISEVEEGRTGWKGYSADHLNLSITD